MSDKLIDLNAIDGATGDYSSPPQSQGEARWRGDGALHA
jgi:hypothetical protein